MIRAEITSVQTKTIEGRSNKTGNDYSFKVQEAWVWTIDRETKEPQRHPQKIELMLNKEQQPYPVGFYELDVSSIYVNRQMRLSISPVLTSVKLPQRAAA